MAELNAWGHARSGGDRHYGIAFLTLAPLPAPEIVQVAADAGYDFAGIRVTPFGSSDPTPELRPGSVLCSETLKRIADTGVPVVDIEIIALTPDSRPDDWLATLETGAALGASLVTVVGADSDIARLTANLAALSTRAREYGLVPALEPISYQPLRSLSVAAAVASEAGAQLMIDPTHIVRGGGALIDIAALDPLLIPVLQLCDGPAQLTTDDDDARALEARTRRRVVGRGEFALAEFVAAGPYRAPISIEVPDIVSRGLVGDVAFARTNLDAARSLVAGVDA